MLRTSIGTAALIVAALATACGSSKNATGQGGSSGSGAAATTGAAGTTASAGTTGAAGTMGDAGTSGAAGSVSGGNPTGDASVADAFMGTPDAGGPYAAVCGSTVKNKAACVTATDVQCANGCGPNKAGYKNCDCFSDVWSCPKCEYVPGNYDCYRLPDPIEACPVDANDAGITLPMVGSACARAACSPCGSATLSSYMDSAGSPKVGYCVCGNDQKWTCASASEWPK